MSKHDVHFSSERMDWETPNELFDKLNGEFGFTLDVCASDDNHKCDKYFTIETDGLSQKWDGVCWMNPPYGKHLKNWIKKAYEESLGGTTVVCLIPSRTDTKYWHEYVMNASEIRFIVGRVKFVGAKSCAPFPSAIVVFNGKSDTHVSSYEY
jgi:site-specific DNA-methyltransferase (adenine-specific)